MEIAVIGGGIAGLTAAWLLAPQHRVTLLERQAQPGLVASSVRLAPDLRVDVPLRVFYPGYYPHLMRLYDALGVATEPVSYATTFFGQDGHSYFRWRNLRFGHNSLPYVLPHDLGGAPAWRIVAGALRFRSLMLAARTRGELAGRTLADFLAGAGLASEFIHGLLLPTLATVATCSHADALAYPADVVADYLAAGVARQSVRRALHGADDVSQRLLAPLQRVVCQARVTAVEERDDGVWVHGMAERQGVNPGADAGLGATSGLVLATQANQALALWQSATTAERAVLEGFSYRSLQVVMHRDERLMPARRADWSAVNARVCADQDRPQSTIWINAVQSALRHQAPLFQTVMPHQSPREDLVLARAQFERPVVTAASQRTLLALDTLQAQPGRRVWLCGSYAQSGVPLLESAVRSAYGVVERLSGAVAAADSARAPISASPPASNPAADATDPASRARPNSGPGLRATHKA